MLNQKSDKKKEYYFSCRWFSERGNSLDDYGNKFDEVCDEEDLILAVDEEQAFEIVTSEVKKMFKDRAFEKMPDEIKVFETDEN